MADFRTHMLICAGTGCASNRSLKVREVLEAELVKRGLQDEAKVVITGCNGFSAVGPVMVVYPEGIFYQKITPEDVPNVASALNQLPRHAGPLDAELCGLGAFPPARRARILWAGVGEGTEGLKTLTHAVETLLEPQGFPREDRPFVPHLTLGRARRPTHLDLTGTDTPALPFPVRTVHLVESRQTSQGVTYETIAEYPLL